MSDFPIQKQAEAQQESAEWCEHEPPVLINDKEGLPIISSITFQGFAPLDTVAALPSPHGHIDTNGDLVVHVDGPPFPWAFFIVTKLGKNGASPRFHSRVAYGDRDATLVPGKGMRVVVTLP